ncbi:MAG: class I SAM-dependent methyltransferase [Cyanobacteria bacterium J06631_9]
MNNANRVQTDHILSDPTHIRNVAERHILQKARANDAEQRLDILEAGCGREWTLDLEQTNYKLTGVDIDKHALAARKNNTQDLDEAIVGDLCSVDLQENSYDVIFNAYVLEHIEDAEQVLDNFKKWLKPGGLMILLFPDRLSVYGFLTRATPHWLHVLYVRHISPWKKKSAGKQGFGPYPTYHAPVVSREGIANFCQQNDFSMETEYGSNTYIAQNSRTKALMLKAIVSTVRFFSFGKLESRYNNLIYVLKKNEAIS